jgi:oxygen-dependent protoporphyrinogen oxidase
VSAERTRIVIVGAGITGLSAAHRLACEAPAAEITLLEADERLGGKIRTEEFAGRSLDVGAEALLARVPDAIALCRELGLGDELVAPAGDRPYVWTNRVRPLPPRLMAGAPGGSGALLRSGILSPAGLARASLDLVFASSAPEHDVSIGQIVRSRLGSQAYDRLIDPLLGGIHAGSCDELSARATAPQLGAALGRGRGLVRGLRAMAPVPAAGAPAPVFLTLRGGLADLVGELGNRLGDAHIRTGATVQALQRLPGGRSRLTLDGGEEIDADMVLLAVPANVAGRLLTAEFPDAACELSSISYASVATVALSYAQGALRTPPHGSGFLVSRERRRTITACTWSSSKWEQLAGESVLLKCSVGHSRDRSALDLDDENLVQAVRADLADAMGLRAEPLEQRVFRFENALPQYAVGHRDRVARIEQATGGAAGLILCGAAYRGVGVASCIVDGQAAAEKTVRSLGAPAGGAALISQ